MPERKLRVIKGHCPECNLRIERRELVGGQYQDGAAETVPRCLHGDCGRCPSFRKAMSELQAKTPR